MSCLTNNMTFVRQDNSTPCKVITRTHRLPLQADIAKRKVADSYIHNRTGNATTDCCHSVPLSRKTGATALP